MSFASDERAALARLLLEVGPDAPTLCQGWNARDLACHLYLRERYPLAAAGLLAPPLAARTTRMMEALGARDFRDVVNGWAAGPPRLSPMRLLDPLVNAAENFVHHEDIRRGAGAVEPREMSGEEQRVLRRLVGTIGAAMLRRSRLPVLLIEPGEEPVVAGRRRGVAERGAEVARVTGEVGELVLWCYGRDAVRVEIEDDAGAIRRTSV